MILVIGLLLWLATATWSYGALYGYFQRAYPMLAEADRRSDRITALLGIVPVVGFLTTLLFFTVSNSRGFQGLKFKD
jgi:hypothetical protein